MKSRNFQRLFINFLFDVFCVVAIPSFNYTDICSEVQCPIGTRYHCLLDEGYKKLQICIKHKMIPPGIAFHDVYCRDIHELVSLFILLHLISFISV